MRYYILNQSWSMVLKLCCCKQLLKGLVDQNLVVISAHSHQTSLTQTQTHDYTPWGSVDKQWKSWLQSSNIKLIFDNILVTVSMLSWHLQPCIEHYNHVRKLWHFVVFYVVYNLFNVQRHADVTIKKFPLRNSFLGMSFIKHISIIRYNHI